MKKRTLITLIVEKVLVQVLRPEGAEKLGGKLVHKSG